MDTKRLAGMIGIAAVVTLGVVGVDRLNKDAKARSNAEVVQVTPKGPAPALPAVRNSFQVDPAVPPLPPLPKESEAPPLVSSGEVEKQLKKSIDNLQKALDLPGAEESSPPPPTAAPPPEPKPKTDDKSLPPLPQVPVPPEPNANPSPPPIPAATPKELANPLPPPVNDFRPATEPVKPETPPLPPTVPPLPVPNRNPEESPIIKNTDPNTPKIKEDPGRGREIPPLPASPSNVAAPAPNEFQQRLNDLEMKYLKLTVAEVERRLEQLPKNVAEHAILEAERKRMNERLAQLTKVAPAPLDGPGRNVWALHLESVDNKTIVQAIVHQKSRFKIVCERLDLQAPLGTLRAVGQVQISGEGFKGQCDRLSIALDRDHLTLEGNAEVGIRTRPLPIVEERKEGLPPVIEPRQIEQTSATTVPILHLRGDHLDLRWSDLQPTAPQDTRADEPRNPIIRGSAGPMVKVAFNSSRDEQWSEWGTLQRTTRHKDGGPMYQLMDREGRRLAYVHAPAGMSLAEHVGKRVSVFGLPTVADDPRGNEVRADGRPMQIFTVSHVAWE